MMLKAGFEWFAISIIPSESDTLVFVFIAGLGCRLQPCVSYAPDTARRKLVCNHTCTAPSSFLWL